MTIDIRPLRGRDVGEILPVDVTTDHIELPDLPGFRDVHLKGTLTITGDGLLLQGTLSGLLEQTCARCARIFDFHLQTELAELFVERLEKSEDEFRYEGDEINADPMVRAVVVLNLPAVPLHDPSCQGLCPVCGKDLNEEPHTHGEPVDASNAFAALKDLKK